RHRSRRPGQRQRRGGPLTERGKPPGTLTERSQAAHEQGSTLALENFVRDVPDFPKQGIQFKDIMPMLRSPAAFQAAIDRLGALAPRPDAVVGIESRGFLFGAPLALAWGVPFVPARKFGKLPGRTVRQVYSLEYGEDTLELHADALARGARTVI